MKKWNVYEKDHGKIEAIKKGFNWWAFLFVWLWAFSKKFILVGIIGISVTIFANRTGIKDFSLALLIQLSTCLVFGILGNVLLSRRLLKNGYLLVETIEAKTSEGAKSVLLETRKNSHVYNT